MPVCNTPVKCVLQAPEPRETAVPLVRIEVLSRTVDTHMRRLRTKLGPAADWLGTVRGVGYRVRDPRSEA